MIPLFLGWPLSWCFGLISSSYLTSSSLSESGQLRSAIPRAIRRGEAICSEGASVAVVPHEPQSSLLASSQSLWLKASICLRRNPWRLQRVTTSMIMLMDNRSEPIYTYGEEQIGSSPFWTLQVIMAPGEHISQVCVGRD